MVQTVQIRLEVPHVRFLDFVVVPVVVHDRGYGPDSAKLFGGSAGAVLAWLLREVPQIQSPTRPGL